MSDRFIGGNVLLIREVQGKIARLDQAARKNTEAHIMILYCHRGEQKSMRKVSNFEVGELQQQNESG